MYDPSDRRFMAADLIRGMITNPQTLNLYVYVLDNPVLFIDPSGLILRAVGDTEAIKKDLQDLTGYSIKIDSKTGIVALGAFLPLASGGYPDSYALVRRIIDHPHTTTISSDAGYREDRANPQDNNWRDAGIKPAVYNSFGKLIKPATPGMGTNAQVFYTPGQNVSIGVYTGMHNGLRVASYDSSQTPSFIVLAHELIHADRYMHGIAIEPFNPRNKMIKYYVRLNCENNSNNPFVIDLFKHIKQLVSYEEIQTIGFPFDESEFKWIPEGFKGHDEKTYKVVTENMIRFEHGLKDRVAY